MNGEDNIPPSGLDHLVAGPRKESAPAFNPFYSRMIRWMRLALPLAALAIAAVVFTWTGPREALLTLEAAKIEKTVGKNELLSPRFENIDNENRPYTLTAKRAVQDENDEKLVILENPKADMKLENGHWVAIEAAQGAFQEGERKLLLRGDVRLFRDGGYQLETPELHIDIKNSSAVSDKDVHAEGPEGTLEAKGLEGRNADGILIFKGPAKLVLNTEVSGGLLQ
jgi:lipopolysaccharide export system protein LptC